MRVAPLLALLAFLPNDGDNPPFQPLGGRDCAMAPAEQRWVQRALDDWEHASREVLRLGPTVLPWIVMFDATCAWHLAPDSLRMGPATRVPLGLRFLGAPVPVWSEAHGGVVRLPTGDSMPVRPSIFAAVSSRASKPYFLLAMPSVFRTDPAAARDTLLELRLLSVVSHEMQHTVQLPDLQRELDKLARTAALPRDVDDNVVERHFSGVAGFRGAVEAERDLLLSAAFEGDAARARSLARQAVTLIHERRARHYRDSLAVFDRIEDLFLTMEGSAEWVRFKIHQANRDFASDAEIVSFIRGRANDWSQDEGLALFLALERLGPSWRETVLRPEMPSPVRALEAMLGDEPDQGRSPLPRRM